MEAEDMDEFDEAGLPPLGTRVRMPYGRTIIEGEVVKRYRQFGEPVAMVEIEMPISHDPYETHYIRVHYSPIAMEIISERLPARS